jgi:hypothetical protein
MPHPPDSDPFIITVGPVSFAVRHGRASSAINEPDRANGRVSADDIAAAAADWAAPAQAAVGTHVLMSGHVVEAIPATDGSVDVSLRSALALEESLMPPMVAQNLTPQEIVYAAARSAGFAAAKIDIHGLDAVPVEPMWVLAPIAGVRVEDTVRIGVVEFMDGEAGRTMLRRFSPPLAPVFTEPLEDVSAYARVAVVARLPYDAEQDGLLLIDTAAAWLTTRLRYSWSHGPNGSLQLYERAPTRIAVQRRDGVGVLAVDGPRRCWRNGTSAGRSSGAVELTSATRWTEPSLPTEVPPGDRQALLALHRAATTTDPVQRVTALWEAIEFYVGKRRPERLFSRTEIDAIVDDAIRRLADDKAARVEDVLRGFLNQPPISARLKYVFDQEGVPVTDNDLALLSRLREERNLALHGSSAAPEHDEIDRGIAVMSRAFITRWYRGASS